MEKKNPQIILTKKLNQAIENPNSMLGSGYLDILVP